MSEYHQPVLLEESIEGLHIKPGGTYVDVTFGGGGHSRVILKKLGMNGRLVAFDQDQDAVSNEIDDKRFTLIPHNFRHIQRFLKLHGIKKVDGILADLGISSHQIDQAERGFAYRYEAAIDMRMNQSQNMSAADVLNEYSAEQLQQILSEYGEVRNAKTLARRISEERQIRALKNISDLLGIAEPIAIGPKQKYLAQVFQALRIEVNDEIGSLKQLLTQTTDLLNNGGRLVVISYHSIEDRIVKRFMKTGNPEGEMIKDFYGNISRPFKVITKKAITPKPEEQKRNPRSRSAKLRIAERTLQES